MAAALVHHVMSVITTSGGIASGTAGRPVGCDGAAVGEQFAAVVKYDDAGDCGHRG
jgi:hypothetical protein